MNKAHGCVGRTEYSRFPVRHSPHAPRRETEPLQPLSESTAPIAKLLIECLSTIQNMLKRMAVPSVTMPSVPSAPMNSLVVSKPAADFLALLRVLMASPFGRTTVYSLERKVGACHAIRVNERESTYQVEEPFCFRRAISYSIGY